MRQLAFFDNLFYFITLYPKKRPKSTLKEILLLVLKWISQKKDGGRLQAFPVPSA